MYKYIKLIHIVYENSICAYNATSTKCDNTSLIKVMALPEFVLKRDKDVINLKKSRLNKFTFR